MTKKKGWAVPKTAQPFLRFAMESLPGVTEAVSKSFPHAPLLIVEIRSSQFVEIRLKRVRGTFPFRDAKLDEKPRT